MAANLKTSLLVQAAINHWRASSGSAAFVDLNSAFVVGTSGAAVAIRFMATEASPINELYLFLDASGGTFGNITMQAAIYNENSQSKCGTTQRNVSTATVMPNAVDKWIKFTFGTPYTPAVGEILWVVAYNTSVAPTVDYPSIRTSTNTVIDVLSSLGRASGFSTTGGFSTNGTSQGELPFVITIGTNHVAQPFTQQTTAYTSNTLRRGFAFTPPVGLSIYSWESNVGASQFNGLALYAATQAPNDSPLASWGTGTTANQVTDEVCGAKIFSPVSVTGAMQYIFAITFGSASQNPPVLQIDDYTSYSTVFDSLYDEFTTCYSVISNADGTAWVADRSICPIFRLGISEFMASGGLLLPVPMTGGFSEQ